METRNPLRTLVKLADAEDIKNEETPPLDLPLEINIVRSKLESQNLYAETQHPNLEVLLAQTVAPIFGVDLTFGSIVVILIYPIFQFQIVFANNAKMKKEKETRFLDRSHLWTQLPHT